MSISIVFQTVIITPIDSRIWDCVVAVVVLPVVVFLTVRLRDCVPCVLFSFASKVIQVLRILRRNACR